MWWKIETNLILAWNECVYEIFFLQNVKPVIVYKFTE